VPKARMLALLSRRLCVLADSADAPARRAKPGWEGAIIAVPGQPIASSLREGGSFGMPSTTTTLAATPQPRLHDPIREALCGIAT
jgi:hypothetical protein